MKQLRVAAVQMASENGRIVRNLERAVAFVQQAAEAGAMLILLPEFLPTGYEWTRGIWNAAEPSRGPTAVWLADTARRFGVWLGTSFLEASGADFYNTFVLASPEGAEAGRVRKQVPALWEGCFFRGGRGTHVIETSLGRIGVGICYENHLAFLPREMHKLAIDLMLMPHSTPSLAQAFPMGKALAQEMDVRLREVAGWFARTLGVPAVMANKCGRWQSGAPFARPAEFLGLSTIADSDGSIKVQLASEEQVIVADVTLDPARKATSAPPAYGRWARRTTVVQTLACVVPEVLAGMRYKLSLRRRSRARCVSEGKS